MATGTVDYSQVGQDYGAAPLLYDDQLNPAPGELAPLETGTPKGKAAKPEQSQQDYGPNNEKLPKKLQLALQYILTLFVNEGQKARRDEVKRCRLAREFWKGLQYAYWTESDGQWHLPWELKAEDQKGDEPRYAFVTNYYQAFGLSIMAVLSQDRPSVRLWPQNAEQPEDVATAAAGSDIIELVERNNKIQELMVDEAFYLWTDGKIGGFVRYVVDGQRFGYHDEDQLEQRMCKVGPDTYQCPNCQHETAADGFMGVCESCGMDLDDNHLQQSPTVPVPVVTQTIQTPNGQEVIDIVGGLELKTPPWANQQHQYPYLIWDQMAHRARLKAAYPHAKTQIGGAALTPEDAQAQYERTAQLTLVSGGEMEPVGASADFVNNLVMFRRAWLRPWAFDILDDEKLVQELRQLFPIGCYVAFAGDAYCESRNETMDDHWRVMHALPGDGQNRPAIGTSFISVQERYNTLSNLLMETAEHGVPATWANPAVVDFDAIRESYVEPGSIYPMTPPAGMDARTQFFQTQPATVSPDVVRHMQELPGNIGQFLTGAFPALFGGEMEGNDTAAGYSMARDQALGRIGLVWRRMKQFHADLMLLSVECFRKNRPDDVSFTIWGDNGKAKSKWIRCADLKGNCFAHPDTDSQYPEVPAQKKAVLQQLMQSEDPELAKILGHPDNLSLIKRIVGLEELVIPDEDARNRQTGEIDQLLEDGEAGAGPLMGAPMMDPTGMPQQGPPQPSVQIDPLDNHEVHYAVIAAWWETEAADDARQKNPMGVANVKAHALAHKQQMSGDQGQPEPPKEAINFKDLPPSGQVQMAAQAGLQLDPNELAAQQQQEQALAMAKAQKMNQPQPGGEQ